MCCLANFCESDDKRDLFHHSLLILLNFDSHFVCDGVSWPAAMTRWRVIVRPTIILLTAPSVCVCVCARDAEFFFLCRMLARTKLRYIAGMYFINRMEGI